MKRREFITGVAAGISAMAVAPALSTPASFKSASRGQLAAPAFRPLPLGSITAEGWLQRQMRLQAESLTGHLDEFWPDVAQSQWFGGKAEGWERAPYWLDGFIPLSLGFKTMPGSSNVPRNAWTQSSKASVPMAGMLHFLPTPAHELMTCGPFSW